MLKKISKKLLAAITAASLAFGHVFILNTGAAALKYVFEDGRLSADAEICDENSGDHYIMNYSGSAAVLITNEGSHAAVDVIVETAGLYEVIIGYCQPHGDKKVNTLFVNDSEQGEVTFAENQKGVFEEITAGYAALKAGVNEIKITAYWGWTFLDYLILKPADIGGTDSVSKSLVNPNATNEAKSLYAYLKDVYSNGIISGQQELCGSSREDEFNYILNATGKLPAIRGFDFMNYTAFVNWDDKCAERLIEWYNEKNGIPTLCWHWFSPMGATEPNAYNCFYTEYTTFSITKALTPGTEENRLMLIDIDKMAQKLKQVQEAGVPVLFRPLHEAPGGWFWWGAEGYEPCIELYRLLYDKFTNEYGINNLIWVWNYEQAADAELWYPGDDVVDIVGYDKYNCSWNNKANPSPIAATFYNLVNWTNGKKMVAMTENDSIPDPDRLIDEMAGWLWFCPWYDRHLMSDEFNTKESLNKIYNSEYCITLDELPDLKNYPFEDIPPENTTTSEVTTSGTDNSETSDITSSTDDENGSSTSGASETSGSGDNTDNTTSSDTGTDTSAATSEQVTTTDTSDFQSDVTTTGTSVTSTAPDLPDPDFPGDVNLDKEVNLADVILVCRYTVEAVTLSQEQLANADVHRDGIIDVTDALKILLYLTEFIPILD